VGAAYPALRRSITVVDPANVSRNLGGLNSFDVAGFLIGPAIAALLIGPLGIRWPFVIAALISLVMMPLTWKAPFGKPSEVASPRLAIGLLRHDWMQASVLYGIAFFTMIGIFDALWAVRMKDLGAPKYFVSVGIIIFASPMIFLGERGGAFVGRTGPFKTGALGLAAGAVLLSLYGLVPVPILLLLVGIVHASNDGMTAASVPVAVSMCAPNEQQAGAQGLVGAAQVLAGGVAAFAAGWAYDHSGPVIAYIGGGIFMLLCVSAAWIKAGPHRHRTMPSAGPY
jgi:predicted MFS family arabinose efflux permease